MLLLIANAMFEATRTATPAPGPAQKRWFRTLASRLKGLGRKAS
ncbi:hypothetical protein SAMN05877838_2468 [Hoeflea halophila]|uniref:Uncharacterized protein n=1 Tax=Hoeflea halophila TaxID=714899 RepID=A0A286IC24_9HYPH|nr:hypothetical protein [Hoeflea halophila]SOE17567.1 hypothetical protein SAMN05877838_2468 [Hoeflea halophila]